MPLRFRPFLLALIMVPFLAGCNELSYYSQAVRGHLAVINGRRPIAEVIADTATPPPLRERLILVSALRDFASSDLALPEGEAFRSFTPLDREAVVWNIVAAPEFSLTPRTWCFPFAGCVPYRGYYDKGAAEVFAADLRQAGDDVLVYGVPAYSTLGWFDDPVLSSFVQWPEAQLAGLIFHELAHQQLYLKDDSAFSEAFARVVEEEGVARWLRQRGDPAKLEAYALGQRRQEEFSRLLRQTRSELLELYGRDLPLAEKRAAKAAIFAGLQDRYAIQKTAWGGYAGYDRWFAAGLNNARLASAETYRRHLPSLRQLLAQGAGDLPAFYRAAAELAALEPAERAARLSALATVVTSD